MAEADNSNDSIVVNTMSPPGRQEGPADRRRQRARPAPLHHPPLPRVNSDASRFLCGSDIGWREPHANGVRDAYPGSAVRHPACSPAVPLWSTGPSSSADHDHNGGRSAPVPGSARTKTSGPQPASAVLGNAEGEANVRLDGCVMVVILATQSAACCGLVQARLRPYFARVRRGCACCSSATRSYLPRCGAAQPRDRSAPRLD
jgi:hypothetical protein